MVFGRGFANRGSGRGGRGRGRGRGRGWVRGWTRPDMPELRQSFVNPVVNPPTETWSNKDTAPKAAVAVESSERSVADGVGLKSNLKITVSGNSSRSPTVNSPAVSTERRKSPPPRQRSPPVYRYGSTGRRLSPSRSKSRSRQKSRSRSPMTKKYPNPKRSELRDLKEELQNNVSRDEMLRMRRDARENISRRRSPPRYSKNRDSLGYLTPLGGTTTKPARGKPVRGKPPTRKMFNNKYTLTGSLPNNPSPERIAGGEVRPPRRTSPSRRSVSRSRSRGGSTSRRRSNSRRRSTSRRQSSVRRQSYTRSRSLSRRRSQSRGRSLSLSKVPPGDLDVDHAISSVEEKLSKLEKKGRVDSLKCFLFIM